MDLQTAVKKIQAVLPRNRHSQVFLITGEEKVDFAGVETPCVIIETDRWSLQDVRKKLLDLKLRAGFQNADENPTFPESAPNGGTFAIPVSEGNIAILESLASPDVPSTSHTPQNYGGRG